MGLLDRFRRRDVVQTDDIWPFLKIPSRAKKIDTAQLTRLIRLSAVAYGNTNNDNMVAGLKDLYKVFVSRVAPEARSELCADLHELITSGETTPTALLPFLDMDPDPTVTSTAAFGFSVLYPPKNDDPMTGPKVVLAGLMSGSAKSPGGLLGGLLLLADERVNTLVWDRRGELAPEVVSAAMQCQRGFLSYPLVDFLISWIEECPGGDDDPLFSILATGLAECREGPPPMLVVDAERLFPAPAGSKDPQRVKRSWPMDEFTQIIEPSLLELEAKEGSTKVMPRVLKAWGIGEFAVEASEVEESEVEASELTEEVVEEVSAEADSRSTAPTLVDDDNTPEAPASDPEPEASVVAEPAPEPGPDVAEPAPESEPVVAAEPAAAADPAEEAAAPAAGLEAAAPAAAPVPAAHAEPAAAPEPEPTPPRPLPPEQAADPEPAAAAFIAETAAHVAEAVGTAPATAEAEPAAPPVPATKSEPTPVPPPQEPTPRARTAWDEVVERYQGFDGVFPDPVTGDLVFSELFEAKLTPIIQWGTFDPFDPALHILGLARVPGEDKNMLVLRTNHPHHPEVQVVGITSREAELMPTTLVELAVELCDVSILKGRPVIDSVPTHVVVDGGLSVAQARSVFLDWMRRCAPPGIDAANARHERYWLKPWECARAALAERVALVKAGLSETRETPDEGDLARWWSIATDPHHLQAEFEAIPVAWNSAMKAPPRR